MRLGGCLCGANRYQIKGEPVRSGLCHCRTCRKAASAPTLPFVVFPAAAFTFTQGKPVQFRSSPHVTRSFCGQCGSPLTYQTEKEPNCVDVMTCSLDDPEALAPEFHVWVSHKLAWECISDGLPAYATLRQDG